MLSLDNRESKESFKKVLLIIMREFLRMKHKKHARPVSNVRIFNVLKPHNYYLNSVRNSEHPIGQRQRGRGSSHSRLPR